MEWQYLLDDDLDVAGLSTPQRQAIVRVLWEMVNEKVLIQCEDQVKEWWGIAVADLMLRGLVQGGGRRTWNYTKRGKPGLLYRTQDLERPELVHRHGVPYCLHAAARSARMRLRELQVDVSSQGMKSFEAKLAASPAFQGKPGQRMFSKRELHRRVAQVIRFYGIGKPVTLRAGKRAWRFYPWRMACVNRWLTKFGAVFLRELDWLPREHLLSYFGVPTAKRRAPEGGGDPAPL